MLNLVLLTNYFLSFYKGVLFSYNWDCRDGFGFLMFVQGFPSCV